MFEEKNSKLVIIDEFGAVIDEGPFEDSIQAEKLAKELDIVKQVVNCHKVCAVPTNSK